MLSFQQLYLLNITRAVENCALDIQAPQIKHEVLENTDHLMWHDTHTKFHEDQL
jgi:hypothetical protein